MAAKWKAVRYFRHTDACATGARAETRGACDCGAADQLPRWIIRIADELAADGTPLLEIVIDGLLNSKEASALYFAIHECQVECARLRNANRERARRTS